MSEMSERGDERTITVEDLTAERIGDLDGITVGSDGEPRFEMEVFDNTGAGPHEE